MTDSTGGEVPRRGKVLRALLAAGAPGFGGAMGTGMWLPLVGRTACCRVAADSVHLLAPGDRADPRGVLGAVCRGLGGEGERGCDSLSMASLEGGRLTPP